MDFLISLNFVDCLYHNKTYIIMDFTKIDYLTNSLNLKAHLYIIIHFKYGLYWCGYDMASFLLFIPTLYIIM